MQEDTKDWNSLSQNQISPTHGGQGNAMGISMGSDCNTVRDAALNPGASGGNLPNTMPAKGY